MVKDLRKYLIIKLLLYPLSFLYGFITDIRNFLYNHRIIKIRRFEIPIISIGNIIAGGTGKTPFTMLCIDLLKDQYKNIVIVSRGYGRKSKGFIVVSDGQGNIQSVDIGGDEPVMIAKKYPQVPVIVSEDRREGIDKAIQTFNTDLVLLDDAFQHRPVERNCDIVLINGMRRLSHERLLPVGDLREKIFNIDRADIVVLNESRKKLSSRETQYLDHIYKGPVFTCRFSPHTVVNSRLQKIDEVGVLKGKDVYLFSAIASPEQFENMIIEIGATVKKVSVFPDHHYYRSSDIEQIRNEFQTLKCEYLVTTEKDIVKIENTFFEDLNIVAVGLEGKLNKPKVFIDKLNQYIDIKI